MSVDFSRDIRAILVRHGVEADGPGCSVAIVTNQGIVHREDAGYASLEHAAPVTEHTRFHLCSVSKPFLGAAFALLAAAGSIDLETTIARHFPCLPNARRISLRRMLSMTSGLRDSEAVNQLRGIDHRYCGADRDWIDLAEHQQGVFFEPGAAWGYSNINFVLLAAVLERVTGQSHAQTLGELIFEPLGMDETLVRTDDYAIVPALAQGYALRAGEYVRRMTFGFAGPAGLVGTSSDVARFLAALMSGRLGGDLLATMSRPAVLADGRASEYGLGIKLTHKHGFARIFHDGGMAGYATNMELLAGRDAGVVVLCNCDAYPANAIANDVLALLEPAIASASPYAFQDVPLPWPLEAAGGIFVDEQSGDYIALEAHGAELAVAQHGSVRSMRHAGGLRFRSAGGAFAPSARLVAEGGTVTGVDLDVHNRKTRFLRATPHAHSRVELEGLVGRYACEDIAAHHRVLLRDGAPFMQLGNVFCRSQIFAMQEVARDTFRVAGDGLLSDLALHVRFKRSGCGEVLGYSANTAKLRDLRFERASDGTAHGPTQ